jgi:hypothetical protein
MELENQKILYTFDRNEGDIMNTAELIYQKAKTLPEVEAREILDFIEFLKTKRRSESETAYLLQEPANARRLLAAADNIWAGRCIEEQELLPDD